MPQPQAAVALIAEANGIVAQQIVEHERDDESDVYPRLAKFLADGHGLGAMSRAHREIMHLARLLDASGGRAHARTTPTAIWSATRSASSSRSRRWCASTTPRRRTSTSTRCWGAW